MLYFNTITKQRGVSIDDLRNMYPNSLVPEGIQVLSDWVSYQETPKPVKQFYNAQEQEPVNNEQVWILVPTEDKVSVHNEIGKQIDNIVDSITHDFKRFRSEYEAREQDAKNYASVNFEGVPGDWLKGFADKAGIPYRAAAELVIGQSVALRAASKILEDQRMRKYTIKKSDTVDAMVAKRDAIIADVYKIAKEYLK